jgi:hypothetical protein
LKTTTYPSKGKGEGGVGVKVMGVIVGHGVRVGRGVSEGVHVGNVGSGSANGLRVGVGVEGNAA